jgi:hypothetical protein
VESGGVRISNVKSYILQNVFIFPNPKNFHFYLIIIKISDNIILAEY